MLNEFFFCVEEAKPDILFFTVTTTGLCQPELFIDQTAVQREPLQIEDQGGEEEGRRKGGRGGGYSAGWIEPNTPIIKSIR
jgi:hypothetical protein